MTQPAGLVMQASVPRSAPHQSEEVEALVAGAATFAVLVSAVVIPASLAGISSDMLHRLLLLPAAAVGYAAAGATKEWRVLAAPLAIAAATIIGVVANGAADSDFALRLWPFVVIALYWTPWPRLNSHHYSTTVLWAAAIAPAIALFAGALAGDVPSIPEVLSGARLHASGSWNELAPTLLLGAIASHALTRRGGGVAALALVPTNLVLLALTGSRRAGVTALTIGIILVFRALRNRPRTWAAILPWAMFASVWLPRVLSRSLSSGDADSVLGVATTGRLAFWQDFVDLGEADMLLGGGWERSVDLSLANGLPVALPHNEYLWLLIDVGVAGLVVVSVGIAVTLHQRWIWLDPDDRWTYGLPLLLLPVGALIDNTFQAITFTMPLAIVTAALAQRDAGSHHAEP